MEEYSLRKGQKRKNLSGKKKIFPIIKYNNLDKNKFIKIYQDTVRYFQINKIPIKESKLYNLKDFSEYKFEKKEEKCVIFVENIDTLDMAEKYTNKGLNVLCLNMASDYKPGGGVKSGKTAQEECLFRRSNAHLTHPEEWYPLSNNSLIHCPEVTVIKNSNYELIKNFTIGMITVAAIRNPKLISGIYQDDDRDLMTQKIEAIFKIGIINRYDCLVLGAFGCGVFNNPPEEVAKIYSIMINLYSSYFKEIGFAVLCINEKDKENLKYFSKLK